MGIELATVSNLKDNVGETVIKTRLPEGISDQDETQWQNTKFSTYFGYYKECPEAKA